MNNRCGKTRQQLWRMIFVLFHEPPKRRVFLVGEPYGLLRLSIRRSVADSPSDADSVRTHRKKLTLQVVRIFGIPSPRGETAGSLIRNEPRSVFVISSMSRIGSPRSILRLIARPARLTLPRSCQCPFLEKPLRDQ